MDGFPVCRLFQWIWTEDRGENEYAEVVMEAALRFTESKSFFFGSDGKWKTEMFFYNSMLADDIYGGMVGLTLHEQPSKQYLVNRDRHFVVETEDTAADGILGVVNEEVCDTITFEGYQFKFVDFEVKFGICSGICSSFSGTKYKGMMMEVEYLSSSSIEISRPHLDSFSSNWVDKLARFISQAPLHGFFVHQKPPYAVYGLKDHYTAKHTALQYATCMQQVVEGAI